MWPVSGPTRRYIRPYKVRDSVELLRTSKLRDFVELLPSTKLYVEG
jgi:hypothetical protein